MKKKNSLLYLCTIIYAVSLGMHYVWEMAQMPFYVDMRFGDPGAWLSCFEAAVVDAVIVVGIFVIGRVLFGVWIWIRRMTIKKIAYLVLAGTAVSTVGEITSLHYERWAYSPLMPLIPVIEVGLVPVVQMIVLPYLCYRLAITMYPHILDSA
jgi:uncharacterized protein YacL